MNARVKCRYVLYLLIIFGEASARGANTWTSTAMFDLESWIRCAPCGSARCHGRGDGAFFAVVF